ncbi:MAG: hypothetical protein ABSD81_09170 [Methanomicrobiales archaeon]|jgi:hypothetical protein
MPEERDGEESDCLLALERLQNEEDLVISSDKIRNQIILRD